MAPEQRTTLSERHLPRDLTTVEIYGHEIGVWRLDERDRTKTTACGSHTARLVVENARRRAVGAVVGVVDVDPRQVGVSLTHLVGDGKFLKTLQMRNLSCALYFDSHGQPWMATGLDGQFLKLDRNGKVLGAVGNGMGIGTGQFIEAGYWAMDKDDNLYAGDTVVGRVTKMVAPEE